MNIMSVLLVGACLVHHSQFWVVKCVCVHHNYRDCWPVYDKKLEQQFRKACSHWFARIAKVCSYVARDCIVCAALVIE